MAQVDAMSLADQEAHDKLVELYELATDRAYRYRFNGESHVMRHAEVQAIEAVGHSMSYSLYACTPSVPERHSLLPGLSEGVRLMKKRPGRVEEGTRPPHREIKKPKELDRRGIKTSKHEKEFIQRHARFVNDEDIAKALGRSRWSVLKHKQTSGIYKTGKPVPRDSWVCQAISLEWLGIMYKYKIP